MRADPPPPGLSESEAIQRLRKDGPNELPSGRRRRPLDIVLHTMKEPMFLLLLGAATLYLALGEPREGATLLGFVVITLGITLIQELRSERALEALRDLAPKRARVVRDREEKTILSTEVVRGDLVRLAEGDRIPADGRVLVANELATDESILTGESEPVRKLAAPSSPHVPPGDDAPPIVFAGTMVVQGQGETIVTATGARTEIGRIGQALDSVEEADSPLHRQTARLIRVLALVGVVASSGLVLFEGFKHGAWIPALLSGIALAMALLPEEYAVILTVFPAIGARRLAKSHILTRRLSAIETLGATSVLCVDKTGTLTLNRMRVAELWAGHRALDLTPTEGEDLPEHFHELAEIAILASEISPFDPMEQAIHQVGQRDLAGTEHLHADWTLVHEYALTPELRAMSHVWRAVDRPEFVVAAKGSPEAIIDLCHLTLPQSAPITEAALRMASRGLRVLGVARARFVGEAWPTHEHDFDFEFTGLVGLADPLRPIIPDVVRRCREAGIRVIMITGDFPRTAQAIARQAGIPNDDVLSGDELAGMDDESLRQRLRTIGVCARIAPTQKLRIVQALQSAGEVVAMTGDGVNDAPALRAAHVGVAMGAQGTDVARAAASLVLLDDNFASILTAVEGGRRIFANLQKAMSYVLAVHVPLAGSALIPSLLDWPALLLPLHIAFMELVIDPSCSLAFEADPAEPDGMRRSPRLVTDPLFSLRAVGRALLRGSVVLFAVLASFAFARGSHPEAEARAFAFVALVIGNLALIFAERAGRASLLESVRRTTRTLAWITALTLFALALVLYVPFLAAAFRLVAPPPTSLLIATLFGAAPVILLAAFQRPRPIPNP